MGIKNENYQHLKLPERAELGFRGWVESNIPPDIANKHLLVDGSDLCISNPGAMYALFKIAIMESHVQKISLINMPNLAYKQAKRQKKLIRHRYGWSVSRKIKLSLRNQI